MIYLFCWSNKDFSWRVNKYLLVFLTLSVASSITWPRKEIIVHWHIISQHHYLLSKGGSCTTSFWEQVMVLFRIIRQDLEEKNAEERIKKTRTACFPILQLQLASVLLTQQRYEWETKKWLKPENIKKIKSQRAFFSHELTLANT